MRISDWSSDVCSSDLHSQCALVGVVLAVAAIAGVAGVAVQRRGVTVVAGGHAVRTQQHERVSVVIEVRWLPCGFVVARGAGIAQPALVRVVIAMTTGAINRKPFGVYMVAIGRASWRAKGG